MILDLFAGMGGWDEGLRQLGRSDVLGIETDDAACDTRYAAGHATWQHDVSKVDPSCFAGQVKGLIASPPCSDWSVAGKRAGRTGRTGGLVDEVSRWMRAVAPMWLACEQVPPALEVWEEFVREFRLLGYSAWCGILNAADFGVPQTRRRAILLAHHERPALPPEPTHARGGASGLFGDRLPWVSMAEALGWTGNGEVHALRGKGMTERHGERPGRSFDEPSFTIRAGGGGGCGPNLVVRTENLTRWKPGDRKGDAEHYERPVDEPAPTVASRADLWTLHTNRDQRPDGSRQTVESDRPAPSLTGKSGGQWQLRPGSWADGRENGNRRAYDPDEEPAPTLYFGHDSAAWAWERPATTVSCDTRVQPPGHKQNAADPPGRYEGRAGENAVRITVAEALVLQGFDPAYPVRGTRTKQFEQVGNAVPPPLAKAVLGALVGKTVEAAA